MFELVHLPLTGCVLTLLARLRSEDSGLKKKKKKGCEQHIFKFILDVRVSRGLDLSGRAV